MKKLTIHTLVFLVFFAAEFFLTQWLNRLLPTAPAYLAIGLVGVVLAAAYTALLVHDFLRKPA